MATKALCARCGGYHDVQRVLEDDSHERTSFVYLVARLGDCPVSTMAEQELLEARARFDREPLLSDDGED